LWRPQQQLKKEKEEAKAKKHADHLLWIEESKQLAEIKKEHYIQKMKEQYGSRWFNFV
jgi:hypothetical protein